MADCPTILLAEDEPLIRLSLLEALEEAGYGVVLAVDGHEAVFAAKREYANLVGLVTDIKVGRGPNGWEVARTVRELNPTVCVVYITGDSSADWPANGVPKSIMIAKPFADAQVVTAISTLLNELP